MIVRLINKTIGKLGFRITKVGDDMPSDIAQDRLFLELYNKCKPFTMTTIERMYSLYTALEYIVANNLPGDFVECGVWRGGSSMMIASYLLRKGISDRKIWLYDTFEGMSAPSQVDRNVQGHAASALLDVQDKKDDSSIWCYASMEDVQRNLHSTGYPKDNLVFVRGKVEDTLSKNMPGPLSLLRLDTDWYESTKTELELLYPLLVRNGVLIIDDFGFWEGAKKAVVEYFEKTGEPRFLHRIDFTGRILIK